jgi:hypothetical protein
MPRSKKSAATAELKTSAASPPLEAKLWLAADTSRSSANAPQHELRALGLMLLNFILGWFEVMQSVLRGQPLSCLGCDPIWRDGYLARSIFLESEATS